MTRNGSSTPGIVSQVFEKAQAIEERWRYRPSVRFRWRIGRAAYDEIVRLQAGDGASDGLRQLAAADPGHFKDLAAREDQRQDERLTSGRASWGKEGSTLLGWPIVCDESFEGVEPEVAVL